MPGDEVDKEPARIAAMFNSIAGRYDALNHLLSAGLDRRWRARAIQSLSLAGGERVLDLCTGTGDVAMAAARAHPAPSRVVGFDFAASMLAIGREKVDRARVSDRVTLIQGDAACLGVASQSVDAVTVAFGIRNVKDLSVALREVVRVLRPGGRLAILEFGTPQIWGIRSAYRWYFRHVLPRIGALISGHHFAYSYLPASVAAFPEPEILARHLETAGFRDVRADPLTFGIVYLYSARV